MKIEIIRLFKIKSDYAKNALTLTIGTGVAQAIPALIYPFLGRLYSPEEFGVMATVMSITAIISVLAVGKYEASILIADTKNDAANIIAFILLLSFVVLSILLVLTLLFNNKISIIFGDLSIGNWIFICPISAFLSIIYVCYNEWCIRNKYFVNLSLNKILNSGTATLGKLMLGFNSIFLNGLIIGDLAGKFTTALICIHRVIKNEKDTFLSISLQKMKKLAIRYSDFPKFSLPGALLNTIGGQLPVILIGVFFSSLEVGYFSMTMTVLSAPSSVISAAIRDTFRQRANEEYKDTGQCNKIFVKTFRILAVFSFFGFFLLFLFLPSILCHILGEQWKISGVLSQIMIPAIALSFISNSLNGVLVIAEKMKIGFLFQVYYLFITFTSLIIGFSIFNDIKYTLICYSIGMSSAYLLGLTLNYKYSFKKHESYS